MATAEQPVPSNRGEGQRSPRCWPKRVAAGGAVLAIVIAAGAFAALAFGLSGTKLDGAQTGLAKVDIDRFGGDVELVRATSANGDEVPVALRGDRIVPEGKLAPGTEVDVEVVVKRPGTIGWLAGSTDTETISVRTPRAKVAARWLNVRDGKKPRVEFSKPIRFVAYGAPGELVHRRFAKPRRSVSLGDQPSAGSAIVAAAPQPWEKLGKFKTVTWFPASGSAAVAASPAAGSDVSPSTPLHITFSKPVEKVLGDQVPTLDPEVPGKWRQTDRHSLVFHPTEYGAPLAVELEAKLPEAVDVVTADGSVEKSDAVTWNVPGGSTLRLQQLLAQAGYLPVKWTGEDVEATPEAQAAAATDPPEGHFDWRWKNTPAVLKSLWKPGAMGVMTEGALMTFQAEHELEVDGVPGPELWKELMAAAIAGERKPAKGTEGGYSIAIAYETVPQRVKVWHNGEFVFETAANTGIPGAETELGTFPVFEHLEETTMSGENPDGSKYVDPGIMWVSYFNGGDALHAFDRPSYGTPQSLGCVEMPLEDAAEVYPYTPLGTLVTVTS